jgi:hypothetical protein
MREHRVDGLAFLQGAAEELQLPRLGHSVSTG